MFCGVGSIRSVRSCRRYVIVFIFCGFCEYMYVCGFLLMYKFCKWVVMVENDEFVYSMLIVEYISCIYGVGGVGVRNIICGLLDI